MQKSGRIDVMHNIYMPCFSHIGQTRVSQDLGLKTSNTRWFIDFLFLLFEWGVVVPRYDGSQTEPLKIRCQHSVLTHQLRKGKLHLTSRYATWNYLIDSFLKLFTFLHWCVSTKSLSVAASITLYKMIQNQPELKINFFVWLLRITWIKLHIHGLPLIARRRPEAWYIVHIMGIKIHVCELSLLLPIYELWLILSAC